MLKVKIFQIPGKSDSRTKRSVPFSIKIAKISRSLYGTVNIYFILFFKF